MVKEVLLTAAGAEALRAELAQLVNERRPELARLLREAVAEGDLKENANYHDAREQQGMVEMRIRELERIFRQARVIDELDPALREKVGIGSLITLRWQGETEDETWQLVDPVEANPHERRLSSESPVGKALLGHSRGKKLRVNTPGGETILRIRKISLKGD